MVGTSESVRGRYATASSNGAGQGEKPRTSERATDHHLRSTRTGIGEKEIGLFQMAMPAVLANVLGLPAVTLPIATSSDGLPIGVQLMGRPYEDELLLEIAVRLEEARGPWGGPPGPPFG